MNPIEILTVKQKNPLFKGSEVAHSIEHIELEEVGYDLVAQKDLYNIGDKVVYIQPDYCLPDLPIFENFIRPLNKNKSNQPDEKLSYLGRVEGIPRRIRAKKFAFSLIPNGDAIYSNGILLPLDEVKNTLNLNNLNNVDLTTLLNVFKYEELEKNKHTSNNKKTKTFPEGIYKTDETNIHNLWKHLEKLWPIHLVGTTKIDGSSITVGVSEKYGDIICSRSVRKEIFIKKVIGKRRKTFLEYLQFWKKVDLNIYKKELNDDDFVKHSYKYLTLLKQNNISNIILRGEINGGSLKGSGNKNNPSKNKSINIMFFGADEIINGVAVRIPTQNFYKLAIDLNLPITPIVFSKVFESKEDLLNTCKHYFKDNLVEGIVVRNKYPENPFSAKIMNEEYDSKK